MARAGNANYREATDLPAVVPVFPLEGVLLLPRAQLPLNVFEPRYVRMVDDVLAGERLIGIIQPALGVPGNAADRRNLVGTGCLGRIVSWSETGDGRYLVILSGIARFHISEEIADDERPYRRCRVVPKILDLESQFYNLTALQRTELNAAAKSFLQQRGYELDWTSLGDMEDDEFVTTLAMLLPLPPLDRQIVLEASSTALPRILSGLLSGGSGGVQ